MVLRGSKLAPKESIQEEIKDLIEVKEEKKKKEKEKDKTQHSLHVLQQIKPLDSKCSESVAHLLQGRIKSIEKEIETVDQTSVKKYQLLKETFMQLLCGGLAGAVSRTSVAPVDRVKILMQTQYISLNGAPDKYVNTMQAMKTIVKEEGVLNLWRGNLTNVIRVAPYSATQFASYDFYKQIIFTRSNMHSSQHVVSKKTHQLSTTQRLLAGAFAGTTATTVTHPLDVIRLRLSIEKEHRGAMDALRSIWNESGLRSFYKGYIPTVLSLAPFIGINFACFDTLKSWIYPNGGKTNTFVILGLGACAGIVAQTICYPLDTIRRRMQMKGQIYRHVGDAFTTILQKEGYRGFYRGMVPNTIKVVPNNAIRFVVYDLLKMIFGISGGRSSDA